MYSKTPTEIVMAASSVIALTVKIEMGMIRGAGELQGSAKPPTK